MLRRGHKKSRTVFANVQCDEGRPICSLCISSGRECSYLNQVTPQTHLIPAYSHREVSTSPGNTASQGTLDRTFEEEINLKHMELLVHLATDKELLILTHGPKNQVPNPELALGLKKGLESPYLMYQLLAFSARHLAFLKPEHSTSYLHQAVTLQTRAVSIFNASWTEINQSNCVDILLFSSILGHHLLTDTLAKRTPEDGLDEFMTNYVQFVDMHRGVHTIAMTAKTQLMQSELEPIISWSASFTSRSPRGNDCQRVRDLVNQAESLGMEDKKACQLVIKFLQVGFDAVFSEDEHGNRYHMLCTWPMLGPPEFTALLVARKPEALAILAYYAALLHHGKHLWQIGDAGAYMLRIISDFLGSEGEYWLEYPRHSILQSLQ
uniref:Putative Zn2Cys6 transcription factor n=1 Tax=Penicillium aethiopicum TaxID=36650 RepID=F1CWE9_PENAE|nr:putative Zn2Cys6 transcription factor [Penicillium aethiopicum]